jgi:hypothetical protein
VQQRQLTKPSPGRDRVHLLSIHKHLQLTRNQYEEVFGMLVLLKQNVTSREFKMLHSFDEGIDVFFGKAREDEMLGESLGD